jgi:hypothetical protein
VVHRPGPRRFGRKPADYDPSAFQGIHARYMLVIIDGEDRNDLL